MPAIPEDDVEMVDAPPPQPPSPAISDLVRENPISALFGAFLTGILVSRLWR
jgi:hypothetical protein